ncbi:hypothetical protein FOXYSP1_19640 [Fusarium oxysporum f. sp. phaseoli]
MATSHSSATSTTPSRNGNGRVTSPDTTSCTSQAPVVIPPKRRPHRIYQPAKNSLYDIFQQHSGTALFVRPICWTDLHAQLLGVKWEELPPCDTPQLQYPQPRHLREGISILLPDPMHPILSSNAVKTTLMTLWPEAFGEPHYLPEFHLYFGGLVYHQSQRGLTNPSTPHHSSLQIKALLSTMICYVGKTQLASVRNNSFRLAFGPGRSWNEPVFRLQQLRARMLVPLNSDHDAHFVGLFLGMAQKHFYPSPPITGRRDSRMSPEQGIPPCPNFHDLKLRILTHDTDTLEFIVYTGYITKEFLEKFHDPFKAPLDDDDAAVSGLKIEYTRVPIWPILGLRERLGKALGQEVVGAFNPDEIKTWEKEPEE